MTNGFQLRKKKTVSVTLLVFLLLVCVILVCCVLFLLNHVVFTSDGIRFDFAPPRPMQSLDVVQMGKPEFTPMSAPSVHIEDAMLPP